MIEITISSYLKSYLSISDIYMEVPSQMPKTYIVIDRTAHTTTNAGNHSATLAIQSYADSNYNAAVLNDRVCEAMLAAPESLRNVFSSELNSDYPFYDTDNKRYRYQAVFNLKYFEK